MSGLPMAERLALAAIVNGLRKGGEVGDATISAIVSELRAATSISDEWGHVDTGRDLRKLADAIESGKSGA